MPIWDASQYLKFAKARTQPTLDLIHRIDLDSPQHIIDLGCGPGNSTAALRSQWPQAMITGLDSSAEMIETAKQTYPQESWQIEDAASWQPDQSFDLVFSNAMLQWLPDHEKICKNWLKQVHPGGAMAIQVPAHYEAPVCQEILHVSRDPAWAQVMQPARAALTYHSAQFYYDVLRPIAKRVDLWETIYYSEMEGPENVLEWVRGTQLRPFLEALPSSLERNRFEQMLLAKYCAAYPRSFNGKILFPFRRLFFIAYC